MYYRSLKGKSKKVNFETAVKNGLAKDGGLYFPENVKPLDSNFIKNIGNYSNFEIGYKVIKQFIGDSINKNDLKEILSKTIDFNFPVVKLEKNIYSLELFHGPTQLLKM